MITKQFLIWGIVTNTTDDPLVGEGLIPVLVKYS